MTTPSKIANLNPQGYALVTQAGTKIKQAEVSVSGTAVKLEAGLANRRVLFLKVLGTTADYPNKKWVWVGESLVSPENRGIPIFEFYEVRLDVGPDVDVYGIVSDSDDPNPSTIKVCVLEIA